MKDTHHTPEHEDEKPDRVFWLTSSEENKPYPTTTWYRCVKGQEFVELVEKTNRIVGIIFSGNNIGFILDDKEPI